jgi:hypothetical protein
MAREDLDFLTKIFGLSCDFLGLSTGETAGRLWEGRERSREPWEGLGKVVL